jgi:hypothetical protein
VAITPAVIVAAPEPLGRRYGLLTAAAGPLDMPRTGSTITYDPVSCGTARSLAAECVDPEDPAVKTFDPGEDWVEGSAFVAYATLQCGSAGVGDIEARVTRRLTNGAQSAVEQHLGAVLTDVAETVPAPVDTEASSVIGALEQWLYGTSDGGKGYGNVGYLHAPFRMSSYLHKGTLLSTDSAGRIRTRLGTVVVFGDYPDDGSVFITGHVTTWRAAEIAVSPREQVLNRTNNNFYMLAEQEWAVAYDCVAGVANYSVEGMS